MNKYKDAVAYAKNVLGNMKVALKLLDEAEKLKQVATDYQLTNQFDKKLLSPPLTAD